MTIGLPEAEEPLSSSSSSLRNAGVLVVDEDAAFQLGLKTFLREYVGFEKVFSATSGEEALELIQNEESINVITLDYRMPGLTGIDVLEKLSENTPRALTVLMITGYPSDELEKRFRSYNSSKLITSQFLTKPVEFEKLETIILQSYEDLKASQRLTKTLTGEAHDETAPIAPEDSSLMGPEIQESLEALEAKVTLATTKIEELHSRLPSIQERFWLGVLKLCSVVILIWLVLQLGWANKIRDYINGLTSPEIEMGQSLPEPATNAQGAAPILQDDQGTPQSVPAIPPQDEATTPPPDEPAPEPPLSSTDPGITPPAGNDESARPEEGSQEREPSPPPGQGRPL